MREIPSQNVQTARQGLLDGTTGSMQACSYCEGNKQQKISRRERMRIVYCKQIASKDLLRQDYESDLKCDLVRCKRASVCLVQTTPPTGLS